LRGPNTLRNSNGDKRDSDPPKALSGSLSGQDSKWTTRRAASKRAGRTEPACRLRRSNRFPGTPPSRIAALPNAHGQRPKDHRDGEPGQAPNFVASCCPPSNDGRPRRVAPGHALENDGFHMRRPSRAGGSRGPHSPPISPPPRRPHPSCETTLLREQAPRQERPWPGPNTAEPT
jgi:hypothetical protein